MLNNVVNQLLNLNKLILIRDVALIVFYLVFDMVLLHVEKALQISERVVRNFLSETITHNPTLASCVEAATIDEKLTRLCIAAGLSANIGSCQHLVTLWDLPW